MYRTCITLSLIAALVAVGGCSSDKSKRRQNIAPTTSGTAANNSNSGTAPNNSGTAPNNSATAAAIAPLGNATTQVNAQISLGVYQALRENSAVDFPLLVIE